MPVPVVKPSRYHRPGTAAGMQVSTRRGSGVKRSTVMAKWADDPPVSMHTPDRTPPAASQPPVPSPTPATTGTPSGRPQRAAAWRDNRPTTVVGSTSRGSSPAGMPTASASDPSHLLPRASKQPYMLAWVRSQYAPAADVAVRRPIT